MNDAFKGHGTFCYQPNEIMRKYKEYPAPGNPGPADRFAQALRDMDMSHAWVRLFGLEGSMPAADTATLTRALRNAGIHVAGWGYCHGADTKAELALAKTECDRHGITAFIADIEPGRRLGGTRSKWGDTEFSEFIDGLVAKFGIDNLGISTWPVLKIQNEPQYPSLALMRRVADRVAMFAPQAYWMSYPKAVHYNTTGFKEADYPRDDPTSFVRLVIDSWRADNFTRPLVITGQAYWGEGAPQTSILEAKVARFTSQFADWSKIVGLNWWHAGGDEATAPAMSPAMIDTLRAAQLGSRPFASA
ncbi:hypothetical protein [Hyphomicrobium sp.]|nr:hypothetical protein [Hyphomicrobium sp.]KAB2944092.1 MAG: hypothetical protein F9K20_01300 [Hyphomicrobium sp.]